MYLQKNLIKNLCTNAKAFDKIEYPKTNFLKIQLDLTFIKPHIF
jgi:hypothetical protein